MVAPRAVIGVDLFMVPGDENRLTYGRDATCSHVIGRDDVRISAVHFTIHTEYNENTGTVKHYVSDRSTNGTWLRGERLEPGYDYDIWAGDVIYMLDPSHDGYNVSIYSINTFFWTQCGA